MSAWLIRLVGVLLLALAASVAAFKALDRPLESLVHRWAPPPSQFSELRLGSERQLAHWRDEGPREDALPILLLHGTSDSLHTWDGWVAELAKTRRVLRVDLPGFGLTGPAADGDYRMAAYVRFVKAFLDDRGLQRVLIAGNSLGGETAWMTAATHPERVAGLVLLDPAGLPFEPDVLPLGFAASRFGPTAWLSRFLLPRPLVRHSVEQVFARPERVNNALVDRFFEMALREGNREALGRRVTALMSERGAPFYVEAWRSLRTPTLLIWGEQDRLIPPRYAQQYLDLRAPDAPAATLKILPGLGHVPQLEDPQASLAAARPFIDAIR
ncbi:alpha/beta fold hydrolase [Inhella sp.]|uniref:alpha/beta fold hydrolase n=1 Tax=Inhella sp. TaxID=1921806 RepID=UPI0035B3953F